MAMIDAGSGAGGSLKGVPQLMYTMLQAADPSRQALSPRPGINDLSGFFHC
jgi:hypothetical protein